jgi:phosphoribosyl-dephospho-CoA transferase
LKSRCPVRGCPRPHDYDQRTLKEHLLIVHRERPVLVNAVLDLLDELGHLTAVQQGGHDSRNCYFCKKEAEIRQRKVEAA